MVCIAEIKAGLYCNRKASGLRDSVLIQINCIVTQQLGQWFDGRSVSQYTCCIVARKGLRQGCIARQPRTRPGRCATLRLRYGHADHDTTEGYPATRRWGAGHGARDTARTALRHGSLKLRYGRGPRPRHGQAWP